MNIIIMNFGAAAELKLMDYFFCSEEIKVIQFASIQGKSNKALFHPGQLKHTNTTFATH